jgi:hypothetical protein
LNRNPSAKESSVGRKSQGGPPGYGSTANLQGSSFANRPTGAFTGYEAARNRDLSANAAMYRRDLSRDLPLDSERHMRQQYEAAAVNDFRHRSFGRSSPAREHIRSGSPIRRVVHAPAFSHYEAHRQQREDREVFEHQRVQEEHKRVHETALFSQELREKIINTYRCEIEANKLNDRNFATLLAQREDLSRRLAAFDTSVSSLKQDFESQLHS